MSPDAVRQMSYLYSYVWPQSEFTPFQARKGGFWPPETKIPGVGSGHYELAMAQCISYQETSRLPA